MIMFNCYYVKCNVGIALCCVTVYREQLIVEWYSFIV